MAEGDGWLSDKYFIIGSVALGVVSVQVLVIGVLLYRNHQQLTDLQRLSDDVNRYKQLREVERIGRINVQKKTRENLIRESDENGYRYKPIAVVESPFPDRRGTPRQPLLVEAARGRIRFNKKLVQLDYFKEIEEFSHIWVIFVFHCNTNVDSTSTNMNISAKVRPPRLGTKVGCLTTRSPHRPNNIGLSVCKVLSIGSDYIEVSALDMVDGTPVLDIKPYLPCDSIHVPSDILHGSYGEAYKNNSLRTPTWVIDDDVPMRPVTILEQARSSLCQLVEDDELRSCRGNVFAFPVPDLICSSTSWKSPDVKSAEDLIIQVLRQDIRGIAQGRGSQDNASSNSQRDFMCRLDNMEITFNTYETHITVTNISKYIPHGMQQGERNEQ